MRVFCHYLLIVSLSYGTSGRLCFVIVVFLGIFFYDFGPLLFVGRKPHLYTHSVFILDIVSELLDEAVSSRTQTA